MDDDYDVMWLYLKIGHAEICHKYWLSSKENYDEPLGCWGTFPTCSGTSQIGRVNTCLAYDEHP
jgi:hypothetical protein